MATGYNVRVGDADRDAVATQLREHFADGRLTLEELNERLDQTFAAKTKADLNTVMRDLTLENPIRAIREISHDTTCRRRVRLANGRELSAIDIQNEYYERTSRFLERRGGDALARGGKDAPRGSKAVEAPAAPNLKAVKFRQTRLILVGQHDDLGILVPGLGSQVKAVLIDPLCAWGKRRDQTNPHRGPENQRPSIAERSTCF